MPILQWPYRQLHRHILLGAVFMALVVSIAPWRWQETVVSSEGAYLGPAVKKLQVIKAPIPTREQATNLRRLIHSPGVYHTVDQFTLTALCHRTPETEILWSLERTSAEQTLPSGIRILRTAKIPGSEIVATHDAVTAFDRECDVGSYRPLEITADTIYWYQPVMTLHLPTLNETDRASARQREIATYELEAVVGK